MSNEPGPGRLFLSLRFHAPILLWLALSVPLFPTRAGGSPDPLFSCDEQRIVLELGAADTWDPCDHSEPTFSNAPQKLQEWLQTVTENHWIVQFRSPLTATERGNLKKQGLSLTNYVHRLAYVEEIDYAELEILKEHEKFRAAIALRNGFNVSRCGRKSLATAQEWHGAEHGVDDIGRFVSNGPAGCANLGCRHVPTESRTEDPPEAVSVIDGGCVDRRHSWFENRLRLSRDCPEQDCEKRDGKIEDCKIELFDEHATFAAGLLLTGGCGAAHELPNISIWSAPRSRDLYQVLVQSSEEGARVHSLSWHEERRKKCQYGRLARDVDQFAWDYEDALVVASAPNDGYSAGPPGTSKNSISVTSSECDGQKCAMRKKQTTVDGRIKADVAAPGCCLCSSLTCEKDTCEDQCSEASKYPESCDEVVSNTCANPFSGRCANSWATPIVAREATRIRQRYRNDKITPSGALLKATLVNFAREMPGEKSYPSKRGGWGFIKGDASWPASWWFQDTRHEGGLLDPGKYELHEITVSGGKEPLRVTLVWTDPPPSFASYRRPVVNDLDLIVVSPAGKVSYRGNHLDDKTRRSIPCADYSDVVDLFKSGSVDARNNVEQVIADRTAGKWKIYVFAREINVTKPDSAGQGYALVVSPMPEQTGESSGELAVGPPRDVEGQPLRRARGARWPKRRWSEIVGTAGMGSDSNPGLFEDPDSRKSTTMGQGELGLSHRITWFEKRLGFKENDAEGEYLPFVDVDIGLDAARLWHTQRDDTRQSAYDVYASVELRPCQGKRCMTMGARYRYSNLSLGDDPFSREDYVEFAGAMPQGRRQGECELNQLKVFLVRQAFQDREPGVAPEFRRSGTFTRAGIQKSHASRALDQLPADKYRCTGQNLFRDLYLHDFWSTHFGLEVGFEPTDGVEYKRRWGRFNWDGRVPFGKGPICRSNEQQVTSVCRHWPTVRPMFDWQLSYEKADHTDGGAFGRERSDSRYGLDLALVLPFRRISERAYRYYSDIALRFGGTYAKTESNIELFDYDRVAYFVNVDFALGKRTYHGSLMETFPDTPSPGSKINDNETGPQRPEPRMGVTVPGPATGN